MLRTLLAFFIGLSLLTACQQETIPRGDRQFPESFSENLTEEGEQDYSNLYTQEHNEIAKRLKSSDDKVYSQALKEITLYLFNESSLNKDVYSSDFYKGFLALYVEAFDLRGENKQRVDQFDNSLNDFKNFFFKPCFDESIKNCSPIEYSINSVTSLSPLLIYISQKEESLTQKLNYLKVALDMPSKRRRNGLYRNYVTTFLALDKSPEKKQLTNQQYRQFSDALLTIIVSADWEQIDPYQVSLFKRYPPWKKTDKADLDQLVRNGLEPYIAKAIDTSSELSTDFAQYVSDEVQKLLDQSKHLKNYPAFSDIDLNKLKELHPKVTFIALSVYFNKLNTLNINNIFLSLKQQKVQAYKLVGAFELLVRWQIAMLSIESTDFISQRINKHKILTKVETEPIVEETVEMSKKWNLFHNTNLSDVKTYIQSKHIFLNREQIKHSNDFFGSINRNILKVVVVPNMMAMMHKMALSEWGNVVNTFIGSLEYDASFLLELLFTGGYRRFWFNFINSVDATKGFGNLDKKMSLFKHEIIDALHYFFTTKTFEAYKIKPDDFMADLGYRFFVERKQWLSTAQRVQRERYFNTSTVDRKWLNWCHAIKNNEKPNESLHFYHIKSYLLPHSYQFFENQSDWDFHKFYADKHEDYGFTNRHNLMYAHEVNDRIRTEFQPILAYYQIAIDMLKRLQNTNPKLYGSSLPKTTKQQNEIKELVSSYWGQQIYLSNLFADCSLESAKESRRRIREIAFSEYQFLRDILYPIMHKVKDKSLSLNKAKIILNELHDNHFLYTDVLSINNQGDPTYRLTRLGYLYRVSKYLTSGILFSGKVVDDVSIKPVVGSHISVEIPKTALKDKANKALPTSGVGPNGFDLFIVEDQSADDFARYGTFKSRDNIYETADTRHDFSSWDEHEASKHIAQISGLDESIELRRLEFYLQKHLLSDLEYINFDDPDCMDFVSGFPKKCYIKKKTPLSEVLRVNNDLFSSLELNEDQLKYFELIGEYGHIQQKNLGIQLRYDSTGSLSTKLRVFPYDDVSGFLNVLYEQVRSDYLGRIFKNHYYKTEVHDSGHKFLPASCGNQRDGCFWDHEKFRSKEFFTSRKKREGLIFKMDPQILEDQYIEAYSMVKQKFDLLDLIIEQGDELLKEARNNKLTYKYHTQKPAAELKPYDIYIENYHEEISDYHYKDTEQFYLPNFAQKEDKFLYYFYDDPLNPKPSVKASGIIE